MKSLLRRAKEVIHIFYVNRYIFAGFFLFVFASSYAFLYLMNLIPDQLQDYDITNTQLVENSQITATSTNQKGEYPIKIEIDKIGVNTIIQNTNSTDISSLNDLLTHGAVRYPGSGLLGKGNLFVFGHSTSLKIVNNQAYKAFNNLKDLKAGDLISVYSETKKYMYQVTKVSLVNSQNTTINLAVTKPMLTLSSCNTLGAKEDRYLVEAAYIGSEKL